MDNEKDKMNLIRDRIDRITERYESKFDRYDLKIDYIQDKLEKVGLKLDKKSENSTANLPDMKSFIESSDAFRAEFDEKSSDLHSRQAKIEIKLADYQVSLDYIKSKQSDISSELKSKFDNINELETKLTEFNTKILTLSEQQAALAASGAEKRNDSVIDNLIRKQAELEERLAETETKNRALVSKIDELNEKYNDLKEKFDEENLLDKRIEKLDHSLVSLQYEVGKLKYQ